MSPEPHFLQVPDQQTEIRAAGAAKKPSPRSPGEVQLAFCAAVNAADGVGLGELIAPSCVDHDAGPDQPRGPLGVANRFADMRHSFADLHMEADHITATDDAACLAYTLTGTHTGADYAGRRARGNGIAIRGLQLARVDNGVIVEMWGTRDEATALRQLDGDPATVH